MSTDVVVECYFTVTEKYESSGIGNNNGASHVALLEAAYGQGVSQTVFGPTRTSGGAENGFLTIPPIDFGSASDEIGTHELSFASGHSTAGGGGGDSAVNRCTLQTGEAESHYPDTSANNGGGLPPGDASLWAKKLSPMEQWLNHLQNTNPEGFRLVTNRMQNQTNE